MRAVSFEIPRSRLLWNRLDNGFRRLRRRLDRRLRCSDELASRTPPCSDGSPRVDDADGTEHTSCSDENGADDDGLVKRSYRFCVRREGVTHECARDDDPDDRHADEAGDAGDGIVDGRGNTGVAFVGVGEDGRNEWCDRERESEREHEKPRQKIGHEVRVQPGTKEQEDPDRCDQRSRPHEQTWAEAVGKTAKRRDSANITSVTGTTVRPLSSAL